MTTQAKTVVIETCKLEGPALDWAVAKADGSAQMFDCENDWPGNNAVTQAACEGSVIILALDHRLYIETSQATRLWAPSTDWSQSGKFLDDHIKRMGDCAEPIDGWAALSEGKQCYAMNHDGDMAFGSTKRIAVCRAVVLSKLGTSVEVPAVLVGEKL